MQAFLIQRIRAAVAVALLAIAGTQSAGAVEFSRSDRYIPSVAGGLTGWAGYLSKYWPQDIDNGIAMGYRLQRTALLLSQYVDRDLDDEILKRIDSEFNTIREKGVKVIPRVSYDEPNTSWSMSYRGGEASLDQVLRHIRQLAPILRKHADVIAVMQAGFVGAWGEWHSSANNLDKEPARSQIRDALLEALPPTVPLQFRTPSTLMDWYSEPDRMPAGTAAGKSRIGVHNDCMLSGSSDSSTFPDKGTYDYTARLASRAPYGGETCAELQPRDQCSDIIRDGRRLGISYLNAYGALPSVYGPAWKSQGCYDEVMRSIGPRIELVSADVEAGNPSTVKVSLRNVGWSAIFDNRKLAIRLTDDDGKVITRTVDDVHPQEWPPVEGDGPVVTVSIPVQSDGDVTPGRYKVALGLPDGAPSLAQNGKYALPFANNDDASRGQVLDPDTGYFSTGLTIQVH